MNWHIDDNTYAVENKVTNGMLEYYREHLDEILRLGKLIYAYLLVAGEIW